MADYPDAKMKESNIPRGQGHVGEVVDSNIEGRGPEVQTVRVGAKKN